MLLCTHCGGSGQVSRLVTDEFMVCPKCKGAGRDPNDNPDRLIKYENGCHSHCNDVCYHVTSHESATFQVRQLRLKYNLPNCTNDKCQICSYIKELESMYLKQVCSTKFHLNSQAQEIKDFRQQVTRRNKEIDHWKDKLNSILNFVKDAVK